MRVIERKPPYSPFSGVFQCVHCRSKIELDSADVQRAVEKSDTYQGVSVRIRCPVCQEVQWLKKILA